ncbi:fasciclin domain-containing protein [Pontibacter sp. 172403-2]|uniref:fasciclin domain-containing protein n=1 Tax=Pontibacter rufus TaxID=2791028 RepID=UPI0018AF6166|nr:fasciclin domain-containing protein [Pontibacter sp. 172403-2]MBF9252102.1 fasciclin domain-containing protein [Pontibacter sp. 172403-2]
MKKKLITPLAAMATMAMTLFGCASTTDTTDDAAAMDASQATDQPMASGSDTSVQPGLTDGVAADNANASYYDMFEDIDNTEQYTILDLARKNEHLSTFVKLVEAANLTTAFNAAGPLTVLMPTNEAFEELSREQYNYLIDPTNQIALAKVIQAHIIPSRVLSSQFNTTQRLETAEGQYVDVSVDNVGSLVTVGGATIVKPDVIASNGIIQVVNNVIIPEDVEVNDK